MSGTLVGTYSVGECLPIAVEAQAGIDAAVAVELPSLEAKLAGALTAQAGIILNPPTLATQLDAALALVAQLEAAIAVGVPGGVVDFAAMASIIAELQASIGTLQAQAALSASIGLTLGAGAVALIVSDGTLSNVGADIQSAASAVGDPDLHANAVVLLSVDAVTWAALQVAVKTS